MRETKKVRLSEIKRNGWGFTHFRGWRQRIFGVFLKNILDERNMTYKQLSVLTGYAEKTIENYMKFQSTSKKVRKKILEVLEINETGLPV